MKYQHILDGKLLFETNDITEYIQYLNSLNDFGQTKNMILYNLLYLSSGYICNVVTARKRHLSPLENELVDHYVNKDKL